MAAAPSLLPAPDAASLPFEEAMKELEIIVKKLEEGALSLDDSIAAYERGEKLKSRCDDLLRLAEARIEKISRSADGKPTGTEPLDVE